MEQIIGRKLDGRYEIKEIIGIGGMAIVYKAYDSIDDRVVAIKVLKEEYLTNDDFRRRFKNESKAIAVLSHPNIVKVYDVSFGERLQYIVMEYINGITLKEYIDQQHVLTWKEAVHFTVQILRALEHAHERGIVHRDIKPQNIMMLEDGTIKVTDFGIARFANSETRTMTDKAIGSVHYISPEQARGAETDEKSDIYSVGVMMYEMLTGRLPFESDSAVSVAIMQLQKDPKRPREINDTIPEGLEEITLRAMQKDPARRYASAAEMLADIEEFKRNPSIHFEYKYFVDESPTRYVDAIHKIKNTEEPGETVKKKKTKKASAIPVLSAIAGALLLGVLGVVFYALNMLGFLPNNSNRANIEVPNLIGLNYDEVRADPKYKDFQIVKRNTQNKADVPAGQIYDQRPKQGMTAKRYSTIEVDVSLGPQMVQVPDVATQELSLAEVQLRNAQLEYDVQPAEFSDDIANGCVIRTDPAYPASVPAGTAVKVYVSKGPEIKKYPVPDLKDVPEDQAKSAIESAHFKANIKEDYSDTVEKGKLISQSPEAGSTQPENTEITAVYSLGKEVKVPTIENMFDTQAAGLLSDVGLTLKITRWVTNSQYAKGYITYQKTTGTVPVNTEVEVFASDGMNPPPFYDSNRTSIEQAIKNMKNYGYSVGQILTADNNPVTSDDPDYANYIVIRQEVQNDGKTIDLIVDLPFKH